MVQPFAGDPRGDARPVRHESRYYVNIILSGKAGETPTGDDDDDERRRAKGRKKRAGGATRAEKRSTVGLVEG